MKSYDGLNYVSYTWIGDVSKYNHSNFTCERNYGANIHYDESPYEEDLQEEDKISQLLFDESISLYDEFIFLIVLSFSVIKGTYKSTTRHSKHA